MKPSKLKVKCAWCDAFRVGGMWLPNPCHRVLLLVRPGTKVTHSICGKCLAKHFYMTNLDSPDHIFHFK